jgi:transcriptional regulator with XRE-family HTH domain
MPTHHPAHSPAASVDLEVAEAVRFDPRLGAEINSLRKVRRLTLERLAAMTGLSVGFISQIERGQNRPSVGALYKISRALGVSVGWFFLPTADEGELQEGHVVRKGARRSIAFANGIADELLVPNLAGRLELLMSSFEPGSGIEQSYSHEGEEAGIVVEGELELWVEEAHYLLKAGDSFSFDSTAPHRYRNPSRKKTVVIWAITPPSF